MDLRRAMTAGAGAIRDAASLDRAAAALATAAEALGTAAPATREALELSHMVEAGGLMVGSARLRTESRGVHWRSDHPAHSADWEGRRIRIATPRYTLPRPRSGVTGPPEFVD